MLKLLRPKQWTKNLLVFAALIFTGGYADGDAVRLAGLAFVAMCLASSAVYVANDLRDVEQDRLHPKKKHRPIASGAVSPAAAVIVGLLVLTAALVIAGSLNRSSLVVVVSYLVLQAGYVGGLKRVPVLDVFCIATGFLLRAMLGAAAIHAPVSPWLIFCTGCLALMIGFGKRRGEFLEHGGQGAVTRSSLKGYTQGSLDVMLSGSAICAILSYGVYSIESTTAERHPGLVMTLPFVFYGVFRYLHMSFTSNEGEEPETALFADPHLIAALVGFLVTAVLGMQGVRIPLLEFGP